MSRADQIGVLAKLYDELARDSLTHYVAFVDLCDSTKYKQDLMEGGLPDSLWLHRQLICLRAVASHVENTGGTVVKTIGDGLMATYDYSELAENILHGFVKMVIALEQMKAFVGPHRLLVKTSLDYGDSINGAVTDGRYDPLGLCVDRCARLNNIVGPQEIALSLSFHRRLTIKDKTVIHNRIESVNSEKATLKGITDKSFYKVVLN